MAMSESNAASRLAAEYEALKEPGAQRTNLTFLDILDKVIDEEFQNAQPTNSNIDITTVAGTLDIKHSLPNQMAYEIAHACCVYWSKAIETSGDPVSGTSILSIENDAMEYVEPMEAEILSLAANGAQEEHFLNLITVVFKYCRMIIWFVDEADMVTYNTLIE